MTAVIAAVVWTMKMMDCMTFSQIFRRNPTAPVTWTVRGKAFPLNLKELSQPALMQR